MDGKGRNSPISGLRVSSIDLQTYPLVGGPLTLAEMLGDLVARAGAPAIWPAVAGAMAGFDLASAGATVLCRAVRPASPGSQGRELVAFSTPIFNAAVAEFKKTFGTHTQLYAYGQFYVTGRTIDDMLGEIESELRSIYFDKIMFWNADPAGHPDWSVSPPPG